MIASQRELLDLGNLENFSGDEYRRHDRTRRGPAEDMGDDMARAYGTPPAAI